MDIIIKSFNRPYYLERCLRSIELNVSGEKRITILDDGTPQQYLDLISKKFPTVTIHRSPQAEEKTKAIADHLAGIRNFKLRTIPSLFWRKHISNISDIFLMMEEDAWFTDRFDPEEIIPLMMDQQIVIVKLFWCKNERIFNGKRSALLHHKLEEVVPELPIDNNFIVDILMRDTFRITSLLKKMKVLTPTFFLPYYSLYTVSSCLFSKAYWLEVWKNANENIDEGEQLLQAMAFYSQHKKSKYGKTFNEVVNTSYISTSLNPFKKVNFDFIKFNHLMNTAWYEGRLKPMTDYPKDLPISYLSDFLDSKDTGLSADCWKEWIRLYQDEYRRTGCVLDKPVELLD